MDFIAMLGQLVSFLRSNSTADLLLAANVLVWGLHLIVRQEVRRVEVRIENNDRNR